VNYWAKIEQDHATIQNFLYDIQDTCSHLNSGADCNACSAETIATCRGRSYSFLYDLIDVFARHILNEEALMLKLAHQQATSDIALHQQAHNTLLHEMHNLIQQCGELERQFRHAQMYSLLHQTVYQLFAEHELNFDRPFRQKYIKSGIVSADLACGA
jgi:hemerythrin